MQVAKDQAQNRHKVLMKDAKKLLHVLIPSLGQKADVDQKFCPG